MQKPSFSERNGIVAARTIELNAASEQLRARLWNVVYATIVRPALDEDADSEFSMRSTPFSDGLARLWDRFFRLGLDSFTVEEARDSIGQAFAKDEWHRVFDLLEALMEVLPYPQVANAFVHQCNQAFEDEFSGYRIVQKRVTPITNESELESIASAARIPEDEVRMHLEAAIKMLAQRPNPNLRKSIDESISAVEAMARRVAGDPKATLGAALKQIESPQLHGALRKAFEALYGYTSDAGGIRHAFKEGDAEPGFAEAKFMLVACSAFVNYLQDKSR